MIIAFWLRIWLRRMKNSSFKENLLYIIPSKFSLLVFNKNWYLLIIKKIILFIYVSNVRIKIKNKNGNFEINLLYNILPIIFTFLIFSDANVLLTYTYLCEILNITMKNCKLESNLLIIMPIRFNFFIFTFNFLIYDESASKN